MARLPFKLVTQKQLGDAELAKYVIDCANAWVDAPNDHEAKANFKQARKALRTHIRMFDTDNYPICDTLRKKSQGMGFALAWKQAQRAAKIDHIRLETVAIGRPVFGKTRNRVPTQRQGFFGGKVWG